MTKKFIIRFCVLALAIGGVLYAKIHVNYRHGNEGIFVLKGENGNWLTITDDLYHFETGSLLWSVTNVINDSRASAFACTPTDKPCSTYEWEVKTGRGFIKTFYPDGKKLHINLGRFISATGKDVSGLFIGGGLHANDPDERQYNNNKTGMAYFDGSRYFHIWCNVNEGILDAAGNYLSPSKWTYLSSKVLEESDRQLTIISRHSTLVNNVPVDFERLMTYKTGDTFITFRTVLKNSGTSPVIFSYIYGDEPWIGNYDTFSKGNVGWTRDGVVNTESFIDVTRNSYAGIFDYGNPLAGESHNFTGKANFIEWEPAESPKVAYFSNQFGSIAPTEQNAPLASYKTRVIALEWAPISLAPGQSFSFSLRIGMAGNDPKTGFPVKPDTAHH